MKTKLALCSVLLLLNLASTARAQPPSNVGGIGAERCGALLIDIARDWKVASLTGQWFLGFISGANVETILHRGTFKDVTSLADERSSATAAPLIERCKQTPDKMIIEVAHEILNTLPDMDFRAADAAKANQP
ncbi:hypothetical protein JYP52_23040 [Nitratireductor aquibiodomus]|uniref:hypothetical protein n=1 Tax=Nitratireductor aquibiodomus TaxID=204799 RepID=UPI0019D34C2D|nr:hypothetical protein [Nitratireductor aquibiodomus]MBN7764017.1 hypothetical protein [Nitratireductor aquibiodomus]